MQCGGYWQELPVGTESEWKAKEAESGAQRAKSKKKPNRKKYTTWDPVPRTRIELARPKSVTRPSTWRVYQFRHLGNNNIQ